MVVPVGGLPPAAAQLPDDGLENRGQSTGKCPRMVARSPVEAVTLI